MAEPFLTHTDCPDCGGHDCLSVWADGGTYCHQCSKSIKGKKDKVDLITEELKLSTVAYRGISKDSAAFYGINTGFDTEGNPITRVYPYPHKPKVRILPKDFSQNKGFTNTHLFGMDKFNAGSSRVLTIVEGEDDVPAAYEMLGSKYPVVGLPGSGTVKNILKNPECYDYIKAFTSIAICTDNDKAGSEAADILSRAFPNKCYRVNMSLFKDPMAYAEAGKGSDFLYAWINRAKYVPEWDTNTKDQFLRVLESGKDSIYVPTGIDDYDKMCLGLMQGHLTVFTAPEGIGKTEFMRMLEYQLLSQHPGLPFAFTHFEESQMRSLLGLVSYKLQKNVTRRELITDMDEVKKAIAELTEPETMHMFDVGTDEDPLVLVERIKYYANVCDCKYVFFEPIQDLAHQRSAEDGTTVQFLDKLAVQLSRVASETGIGIITVAHQNADGDIRDSKLIGKQASVRIDLTRDLMNPDPELSNTTTLTVTKNRPVGPLGYAGQLVFDSPSFTLKEKVF